ncbi:uncharacterized protein LOC130444396 [Diorhabda sublineata]|uniref:uncharacterized protein LOC130444396 n=1 Tax=Diorhabda sublineata TaxID=1163346 RepID=UPI0024E05878|nr:uncharacterized protein LOC130444396 [Diorhabda sublineata]
MSNTRVGLVCYADDAAIIAESENDLQRQLFQFFLVSRQLNMNISISKTKCMTIAKDPLRCKLVVEDNPIERIMHFRYLGIDGISSTHDPVKDLRSQINKTSALSRCLRDNLVQPVHADRVRNPDVKEQYGIQDIVRWGRQRKRQWYNHVRRMEENRLARIVLENNPPGSRPPGRPPKRWKDSWQSTSQEKMQRQLQN